MHARSWSVLQSGEGDVRDLRPPARSGRVVIKVDPARSKSARMAMGTQLIEAGGLIPVHLHEQQDEILFVLSGRGTAVIEGERIPVDAGATLFVPEGVWHGVENTGHEVLHLLWVITPPGLEAMFRDISVPPGAPGTPMSQEEFVALARRHGMRLRQAEG